MGGEALFNTTFSMCISTSKGTDGRTGKRYLQGEVDVGRTSLDFLVKL